MPQQTLEDKLSAYLGKTIVFAKPLFSDEKMIMVYVNGQKDNITKQYQKSSFFAPPMCNNIVLSYVKNGQPHYFLKYTDTDSEEELLESYISSHKDTIIASFGGERKLRK